MTIRVSAEIFDPGAELARFEAAQGWGVGAVASFVGKVRGSGPLTLEHYPGMAERELERIVSDARMRWSLDDVLVIHRHGVMAPGEPIVLVATAAAHRDAALSAVTFLMDYLKTRAPFWKKESGPAGETWVEARAADDAAAARWSNPT